MSARDLWMICWHFVASWSKAMATGEGDTSTKEGITVKYHPPFSFLNIGQRGKNGNTFCLLIPDTCTRNQELDPSEGYLCYNLDQYDTTGLDQVCFDSFCDQNNLNRHGNKCGKCPDVKVRYFCVVRTKICCFFLPFLLRFSRAIMLCCCLKKKVLQGSSAVFNIVQGNSALQLFNFLQGNSIR